METKTPSAEIAPQCLALRARMLDRALTKLYADALRPFEITPPQLNLLVAIDLRPGLTANELGHTLWLEKSTVSRNLKHLHRDGRVRLARSGRSQHLNTTDTGRCLLKQVLPTWRSAQDDARRLLGPDGEQALLDIAKHLTR